MRWYWLPTYTHPDGPSEIPNFVVEDQRVFPCSGIVGGANLSGAPWYLIVEDRVYPSAGHPAGPSDNHWFDVVGSFVYPTPSRPLGSSIARPFYRIAETPS